MADNSTIALAARTTIPPSVAGASESHSTATNMMNLSQELRREICSYVSHSFIPIHHHLWTILGVYTLACGRRHHATQIKSHM